MKGVIIASLIILLSGCSTGKVLSKTWKVIKDPSIPIGEPSDRPTIMSVSIKADKKVNPNTFNNYDDTQTKIVLVNRLDDTSDVKTLSQLDAASVSKLGKDKASDLVEEKASKLVDTGDVSELIEGNEVSSEAQATPIFFKVFQLKENSLILQADFENLFENMKKTLSTSYIKHDDYMMVPNEYKFIEAVEIEKDTKFIAVAASYHDYANAQWKSIIRIDATGEKIALFIHLDETEVELTTQEEFQ